MTTFNERQEYVAEILENIANSLDIHPDDFELFPNQGNINQIRNSQAFLRRCAKEIRESMKSLK